MERPTEWPSPPITKQQAIEELEAAILAVDQADDASRAAAIALEEARNTSTVAEHQASHAYDRQRTALRQLHCALTGKVDIA